MIKCSVDWAQVAQSDNRTKGIFQLVDHFYLFQHIKLCSFTKFHGKLPAKTVRKLP